MYTNLGWNYPATLGPEIYVNSPTCPGYTMRINDDVRKSVAFLGFGDAKGFHAAATGFIVLHDEFLHFVTAKHVAVPLRGKSFSITSFAT